MWRRVGIGTLGLALATGAAPRALAADPPAPGSAAPADDGTRAAARALAEEGLALYDSEKYAEALVRFEKAGALVRAPTMGLMAGRSLERLGRWVEASERYLAVTRMEIGPDASEAFIEAKENAAKERAALVPRIPMLVVDVDGGVSGVSLTLDGQPLPAAIVGVKRPTDPGEHVLSARRGDELSESKITLAASETKTVTLRWKRPPPGASSPVRTVGWAALAAGGAGLVVGAVTGGLAVSAKGDLDGKGCVDIRCPVATLDEVERYNLLRTVSGAGFVAGGVLAAAGAAMVIFAPAPAPAPGVAVVPWVGVGSFGIRAVY